MLPEDQIFQLKLLWYVMFFVGVVLGAVMIWAFEGVITNGKF
jgi:hypothetical protein